MHAGYLGNRRERKRERELQKETEVPGTKAVLYHLNDF